MAAKKGKKGKKRKGVGVEVAAQIAERVQSRIDGVGTGASAFSHRDVGVDWADQFGAGWQMALVVVVSPGTSTPPAKFANRQVIAIPILGEVQFDGSADEIGSARGFAAGAEFAVANDGDEVAAFILVAQDEPDADADARDGDESDDQGVPVVDVGEHGAGGASEAEESEEQEG